MKFQPNWGMTSPICRIPGLLLGTRFGLFLDLTRNSKKIHGCTIKQCDDNFGPETVRVLPGNCMSLPKRPFSRARKLRFCLELWPFECQLGLGFLTSSTGNSSRKEGFWQFWFRNYDVSWQKWGIGCFVCESLLVILIFASMFSHQTSHQT